MGFEEVSGWIALLLFAISFCTAAKSPKLNAWMKGYRPQLKVHHWIGMAAIAFMIVHLLALLEAYSPSQLVVLSDASISTGWIAFASSAIIVAMAFQFRTAPYRRWRRAHLVLILGFLAAVMHTYLILEPSTIPEWATILIATLIGGWGMALSLWIPQSRSFGSPYIISKQVALRSDLFLQTLTPVNPSESSRFKSGEFVFLRYEAPQFSKIWHPFTVVPTDDSGAFELLIKARGRDTNLLREVVLPSEVKINGPFGMPFWGDDKPQLWIAYGVGIAIFFAACRSMPRDYRSPIHLAYGEKNAERMVLAHEFDAAKEGRKNFSWAQYYGEGQDMVKELKGKIPGWAKSFHLFRVCGHPGFQDAVRGELIAGGVASNHIILEGVF